jgi:hypothetical protein
MISQGNKFFQIKAFLMWTINDFLAYDMVFGWSTYGKLVCLYCMENYKTFTLINSSKTYFFFYRHRRFLPTDHEYKKNINDFFVGRIKRDVAPLILSGEKLYDVVLQYDDIVFDFQSGKQKFLDSGVIYNWIKQSFF